MTQRPQTSTAAGDDPLNDPILARRAQWERFANTGKRLGYTLYLVATIAFFIAIFTGFNDFWGWIVIGSLLAGSALLLPAIIAGYAVKAAHRADLGLPDGH